MRLSRKGQSIVEYALLLGLVSAAFIMTQMYFRNAISGRVKSNADSIGNQFSINGTTTTRQISKSARREQTNTPGLAEWSASTIQTEGIGQVFTDATGEDYNGYEENREEMNYTGEGDLRGNPFTD